MASKKTLSLDRSKDVLCNKAYSCVKKARENARTVRDIISAKMWEDINSIFWQVEDYSKKRNKLKELESYLRNLHDCYIEFIGSTMITMTRNEAWNFMQLGRMIERADQTSRLVDMNYYLTRQVNIEGDNRDIFLSVMSKSLLKSVNALEMYYKEYYECTPSSVYEFLITSDKFPRAMSFCVSEIIHSVNKICEINQHQESSQLKEIVNDLYVMIEAEVQEEMKERLMHKFIDEFQVKLNLIDKAIYDYFFSFNPAGSEKESSMSKQNQ